jgi:hypothetical protein
MHDVDADPIGSAFSLAGSGIRIRFDLRPKFPPALRGDLGVKSVTLGGHFVHHFSLQEFHWRQVA